MKWLFSVLFVLLFVTACARSGISKCPLGSIKKKVGELTKCTKCKPGTYQWGPRCSKCPENTYTSFHGVVDVSLCIPCPPGEVSKSGAKRCRRCAPGYIPDREGNCRRCKPGTDASQSFRCVPCDSSDIAPLFNQLYCTQCAEGFRANKARIKCVRATCPLGKEFQVSYYPPQCYPCPGLSVRGPGTSRCTQCGAGETVDYGKPKTKCIKCKPGTFMTNALGGASGKRLCKACAKGATTRGAGKRFCRKPGQVCPKGMFVDADGDCNICDANFRYVASAKKCVACPPLAVSKGGLSAKCTSCGANSRLSDGQCDCIGGYRWKNGRCRACKAGFFRDDNWILGDCSRCGFNTVSKAASAGCVECPYGTSAGNTNGKECLPFPKCKRGFVMATRYNDFFSNRVCVSAVTGCPRGLKVALKFGDTFCVNGKGDIVCPKGWKFRMNGFGHGDGPRCVRQ